MKTPWILSTLLAVSLLGMAPSAFAQSDNQWLAANTPNQGGPTFGGPRQGGFGPKGGQMQGRSGQMGGPGKMFSQLNLTAEQREKMQALMQKNRATNQNNRETLQQKREQLRTMMQSGSGNKEQAKTLLNEINQLQSTQMSHRIDMMYEMKSILTPEQFQQFQASMKEKQGQRQGQGGQMRGGGQGGGFQPGGRMRGGFMGPASAPTNQSNDGF